MPTVRVETFIDAPLEICFDAARDISLHVETASSTAERAVAGRTQGKIESGEWVTFEGRHFGLCLRLTAKIVEMEKPHRFVDCMTRGAFDSLSHTHEFFARGEATLMRDTLRWRAPLGPFGRLANRLFLVRHMHSFLLLRNARLKTLIEAQHEASLLVEHRSVAAP